MKLYLQFGYGMMSLCKELLKKWGEGTIILSPRDLEPNQLHKFSTQVKKLNGTVLVDPQFYLPRADHHRLTKHDYWPNNYDTVSFPSQGRKEMLAKLGELNNDLETTHFIIPGNRADSVDEVWLEKNIGFLNSAKTLTTKSLLATICLSQHAIRSEDQVAQVIKAYEDSEVYGYYLMLEPPTYSYLVDDPVWLANAMDLVAALKLQGAMVVWGCGNHQQMIMSCAAIDAIASGTWLNVRSFVPGKYNKSESSDQKRRAIWYYCPQALSEYKLEYVDMAVRHGFIDKIKPVPSTDFVGELFSGSQPSASGWGEYEAMRHYLCALHKQVAYATKSTFDETLQYQLTCLNKARNLLDKLREKKIRGQDRDFYDCLDSSEAALSIFEEIHGPILRWKWEQLTESTMRSN